MRVNSLDAQATARDSGRWEALNFSSWSSYLILLGIVLLGVQIGSAVSSGSLFKYPVILVGIVAIGPPLFFYFARGVSFEKVFVVMVLTLPLLAGFAIDIGGTVRLTYLFTVLALLVALQQRKLWKLPRELAVWLLLTFLAYALVSTVFTFWIDFSAPIEAAGFRLTPFRCIVQSGQLVVMVMAFYLTVNYLTSVERVHRLFRLVFWSTAFVTLYVIYDFAAAFFDLPFFSVIYDTSYYAGGAADNPSFRFGGISLPRPRSTLGEPLDLTIFLLFGIPFSIAALSSEKNRLSRWLKNGLVGLEILLFFVANSRSSLVALLVILLLSILIGGRAFRRGLLLWGVGIYLIIALAIFPLAGGDFSLFSPFSFYQERLQSITYLAAALEGDPTARGQIGRGYTRQIEVFQENPILGVGLGNYPFYYSSGGSEVVLAATFSMYLRLLTELGLLGTSLFFLFVARILWLLFLVIRRLRDPSMLSFARAAFLAIVGVMIARVGLDGLTTDSYMWVMLAAGLAIAQLSRQIGAPAPRSPFA